MDTKYCFNLWKWTAVFFKGQRSLPKLGVFAENGEGSGYHNHEGQRTLQLEDDFTGQRSLPKLGEFAGTDVSLLPMRKWRGVRVLKS
ncbi:unnamed protein product [Callosobruchus maculatus]|uniref:Uncharacterized protein n=1 Tax=Callosobruchus maculatus TaxID=64391 RepID=A0A653CVN6_CALMS|nr:unnamed protein product [Callosobruchus maculatus]